MAPVTGLIIGKFLPPHRGHHYLIDYARARVDQLTLILFSKAAEPIPGWRRAGWLRELYPTVPVRHITDEHPMDFASDAVWQLWVASIRRVYPHGPDLVFSSEAYGAELARRLGARSILVDVARQEVPISGSLIRAEPLAYWDSLAPCVRAYYARRVAILGAESTGKTTLAVHLAKQFNTVWVPEFARDYLLAQGGICVPEDMAVIAHGQAANEDRLAREANRLLICDTDLLTTALWYERYWGVCPDDLWRMAKARAPGYALYLLLDRAVPWVDDGLRDSPGHRTWFQQRFQRELTDWQLPYVLLTGTYTERMVAATRAVAGLLPTA